MKNILLYLFAAGSASLVFAQSKKVLDHDAYDIWRKIEHSAINANGDFVQYTLSSHANADPRLVLHNAKGATLLIYDRGKKGNFTYNGSHLLFTISPASDSLRNLKRVKTKDDKLPKDTLAIYHLAKKELNKIPQLQSYKLPEKSGEWLAYQSHFVPDSTQKKAKKSGKETGYPLTIMRLSDGKTWELPYVLEYDFSTNGKTLGIITTGNDSTVRNGVYVFESSQGELKPVFRSKGKFKNLGMDEEGSKFAFHADLDTTKALIRNTALYQWQSGSDSAQLIVNLEHEFISDGWQVNDTQKPYYAKDGTKLYFGTGTHPVKQDTSLLDEEIVNVEVWSYTDAKLHTQQKVDAKADKSRSYLAVYHISEQKLVQLGKKDIPSVSTGNEGNASVSLGMDNTPYLITRSWEGYPDYNDFYVIDNVSGEAKKIAEKIRGSASLSPQAGFAYWYDYADTAWYTYDIAAGKPYKVTDRQTSLFFDELNDSPDYPGPYGIAGWTENDQKILIYDRYDIWEIDPRNAAKPINITGLARTKKISYRYVRLDPDERFIKSGQYMLLQGFKESDKNGLLAYMVYGKNTITTLSTGSYHFSVINKALNSDNLIYTSENFAVFPDIHLAKTTDFKKPVRISNANPQQSQYTWGTASLYSFTSLDGTPLEGLLIKPENFDPNKKYPLIVNFYERSSETLHRHREPSPGRSTINYSFYASRGYVIFNPDIVYKEGYPGESAYNCAMPGVMQLINEGYIDKERIGIQGHSWGGYQIAYMVTRTNLFKCAEAGAPVPNMISAYGGIRWQTGLVRQFQYEHTQSRIGGSLWEYPLRFLENSPIFFMDKINTPLLLMANDADGHVPWYQGIEMFVALRRLGKPSWMLNYQGEPHWPLKLQNRIDFNIRMAQFFDYYLKDAPMPKWMEQGVPAIHVGIEQNLELLNEEN